MNKELTENKVFLRSVSVEELSRLEVNSYEDRKLVLGFCDKWVIVDYGECYFRSDLTEETN